MALPELPVGVVVRPLHAHADHRGVFCEIHRNSWGDGVVPVQWNAVRSRAGTLRGFHVHHRHSDVLTVVLGRMLLGLRDLRHGSPTAGLVATLWLEADHPAVVTIPTGVGHGFAFTTDSLHVYAVDHYWNTDDELRCRWDDPAVGIAWPMAEPLLSADDAAAGTLDEMCRRLAAGSVTHG